MSKEVSVFLIQYCSGDQIEKNEMGGAGWASSTYGGEEMRIQGLVGKPEEKKPLARARLRWEDNIKMDLQEVGCGGRAGSNWLRIGTGGGHL